MHEMEDKVNRYSLEDILLAYHNAPEGTMLYAGTDSNTSRTKITYITVFALHYSAKSSEGGKGCRVFPFVENEPLPKVPLKNGKPDKEEKLRYLNMKLMKEIYITMGYAVQLMYGIPEKNIPGIPISNIEIHSDYNPDPKHKSHAVVKEASAYVQGQGLTYKIKPDAVVATGTADFLGRKNRLSDAKPKKKK